MDKERHRQQVELLKQQNRITEDRLVYLKDMERKLKQIVLDWKKSENKQEVIKNLQHLLFKQKETIVVNKLAKKSRPEIQRTQSTNCNRLAGEVEKELPGRGSERDPGKKSHRANWITTHARRPVRSRRC